MDKLKFMLFSVVVLALLGLVGYWSVISLQSGTEFKTTQKIQQLQRENEDLIKQKTNLEAELSVAQSQIASTAKIVTNPLAQTTEEPKASPTPTTYKNQTLIDQLEKIVTNNVYLKLKSTGAQVGTLQNFLNVYNKTSNKVDNDYGASTQKAVSAFQKNHGLKADGQAGSGTFKQMIAWLKKQG